MPMSLTQTTETDAAPLPQAATRQLNFMLFYIICVYAPFMVALSKSGQNVWHTSLSSIGWQFGGLRWFVWFGVLTMPFVFFQTRFYARFNQRDEKLLIRPLLGGMAIMVAGMLFPDPPSGPSYVMHNILDDAGSTIVMLAVTGIVVRYVVSGGHGGVALASGYGVCVVVMIATIITRGPVAMIEVFIAICVMVVLYVTGRGTSKTRAGTLLPAKPATQELDQDLATPAS